MVRSGPQTIFHHLDIVWRGLSRFWQVGLVGSSVANPLKTKTNLLKLAMNLKKSKATGITSIEFCMNPWMGSSATKLPRQTHGVQKGHVRQAYHDM